MTVVMVELGHSYVEAHLRPWRLIDEFQWYVSTGSHDCGFSLFRAPIAPRGSSHSTPCTIHRALPAQCDVDPQVPYAVVRSSSDNSEDLGQFLALVQIESEG
jgi:hypothetical protein